MTTGRRSCRRIRAALRPGGYLVFETRRPARRAWEEWAAEPGPVTLDVPGSGPVERRREVTAVDLPLVSFRYTYTFLADGTVITSDSTLRFRGREELEQAWPPTATGCWTCGTPPTVPAASSSSSPSAPAERQPAPRRERGR